jgi:heterotetrameric sarcosine oxidase gamma subunit
VSGPEPLAARSPLASQPGAASGWSAGGVHLAERFELSAAMIALPRNPAIPAIPAMPLPRDGMAGRDGTLTVVSCGPRRYLAVSSDASREALQSAMRERLGSVAAIVDYSDQLAFIAVSGPNAELALSRLCSIDLERRVFPDLHAAVLRLESVRAFLWRDDQVGGFMLGVQRSLSVGVWQGLAETAEALATE